MPKIPSPTPEHQIGAVLCCLCAPLLLLLVSCTGATHTPTAAEKQCGLWQSGDLDVDVRIQACTSVINTTPDTQENRRFNVIANAFVSRADAYKKNGQYDLSISDYTQAIQIAAGGPIGIPGGSFYRKRGIVYIYTKQYDLAFQDFTQDIQIVSNLYAADPSISHIYDPRGTLAAESLTPDYWNRGVAFQAQGKSALADGAFNQARNLSRWPLGRDRTYVITGASKLPSGEYGWLMEAVPGLRTGR